LFVDVPVAQLWQSAIADDPVEFEYFPAGHFEHELVPKESAYDEAGHSAQVVPPTELIVPTGHLSQELAPFLEYDPGEHCTQELEPNGRLEVYPA
jgi:hypothetical protein